MGLVRMYKHFLHKSLIIFSPRFLAALGQEIRQKNSSSLSHTDQKHSITLKISLTLLSIKTNIRSSFSLERALLCRIALEKDLFTASLFSIYRWQSTFFDVRPPPQKNKNTTCSHLLVHFNPMWVSCQRHEDKQPTELISAAVRQQLQTQLQSLESLIQFSIYWKGERMKENVLQVVRLLKIFGGEESMVGDAVKISPSRLNQCSYRAALWWLCRRQSCAAAEVEACLWCCSVWPESHIEAAYTGPSHLGRDVCALHCCHLSILKLLLNMPSFAT